MVKLYKYSIFVFTRDLRLHDNTTLIEALKKSENVIPCFIFNPEQLGKDNEYKSNNCIQFMCECLDELSEELGKHSSRLIYFYGQPDKIIDKILKKYTDIEAVFMNKDYTPFATKREESIINICLAHDRSFETYDDYLLVGTTNVTNVSGNPYLKFTPFLNKAKTYKVKKSVAGGGHNYVTKKFKFDNEYTENIHKFYKENPNIFVHGGRSNALAILKKIGEFKHYDTTRDQPMLKTTGLSAYLKFNVVSIREVYESFKAKLPSSSKLITQLYWRDFYMLIIYHNPHVIGHNMNGYKIKWENNKTLFEKWKNGQTGYPIIDAGMRQMNAIGWMHNRERMVVASFLVKIMHIDWKKGEKYFATQLVDYDPANNNGGWNWCGSITPEAQPYFRYFNPWAQSKKHDPDCEYIKKWIPELKNVQNKDIHEWYNACKKPEYKDIKYYKPAYNNEEITARMKLTIKMYKEASKKY